jgi:hypothetical protein
MADGSRHSMAFVLETTYGTTPATPIMTNIRHTQTSLAMSKDSLQSEEIRSDRQIADFRHGARQTGGDIQFELSYGSFDSILEAVLLGAWTADTPVVDTFQLKAGVTRRSFTVERHFGDLVGAAMPYYRYTGVEFNSMQLQVNANAMITGTFSVLGQDLTLSQTPIVGATYPAPTTTSPLDSFTGVLKEGGTEIAVVTEIQLNLENGLEARFVVGKKTTIDPSIARSNCSGQVTAYFEDSTLVNKFINETESSMEFTLPDGAGNEYKFIVPRFKYTGGSPDVGGEGPITLTMPFQALRDPVSGSNLIIERTAA